MNYFLAGANEEAAEKIDPIEEELEAGVENEEEEEDEEPSRIFVVTMRLKATSDTKVKDLKVYLQDINDNHDDILETLNLSVIEEE